MKRLEQSGHELKASRRMLRRLFFLVGIFTINFGAAGCAHYPVNQPITHVDPDSG